MQKPPPWGPLEDTVCDAVRRGFGELGAQLRRDVREELQRALKHEAGPGAGPGDMTGGGSRGEPWHAARRLSPITWSAAPPGRAADLAAGAPREAEPCQKPIENAVSAPLSGYQPHEWTKHHFRRHCTRNYLQELADTEGEIARARSHAGDLSAVKRAQSSRPHAFQQHEPPRAGRRTHSTPVRHISLRARNDEVYTEDVRADERARPEPDSPKSAHTVQRSDSGRAGRASLMATESSLGSAVAGTRRFRESSQGAGLRNEWSSWHMAGSEDHQPIDGALGTHSDLRSRGAMLLHNQTFERAVLLIILANCVTIGAQIDYMATTMREDPPVVYRVVDLVFCMCFMLEVGLRLFVHRCRFFRMRGRGWNITDLALVAMNVAEEVLLAAAPLVRSLPPGLVLRLVRVSRAVRIVRVLRVMRFAEDLRLLVTCILWSAKSFIWAVMLLFLTIYIFGVYLTQSVYIHRLEAVDPQDEGSEELVKWYGSVPLAILSLFQALTGGVDWNDIVRPLMDNMHPAWGLLAVLWIAFSILAVLNIITGTFVHSAIERSMAIRDMDKITLAHRLFSILDIDHNGTISRDEIVNHLDTDAVQEFFRTIDVDTSEAVCLFELLDCSGDGRIDFEEFLSGVVRLQGQARALDMIMLILDTKHGFEKQSAMLEAIHSQVQVLQAVGGGTGARRVSGSRSTEAPATPDPPRQLPNACSGVLDAA